MTVLLYSASWLAPPGTETVVAGLSPEIEPYDHGLLEVGDGNLV